MCFARAIKTTELLSVRLEVQGIYESKVGSVITYELCLNSSTPGPQLFCHPSWALHYLFK